VVTSRGAGHKEVLAKDPPPAIITRKQFARVQKLRGQPVKRPRQNLRRGFLLTGMVVCGECGRTFTGRIPRAGYKYYACNKALRDRTEGRCKAWSYVPAVSLEDAVWGKMLELGSDPEAVQRYVEETERENFGEWQQERAVCEAKLEQARAMLSNLEDAYLREEFAPERYLAKKAELESEILAWQERADTLTALIEKGELHKAQTDYVATVAREMVEVGPSLPLDCKRDILHRLGVAVTVFASRQVEVSLGGVPASCLGRIRHGRKLVAGETTRPVALTPIVMCFEL
jgi:hypothetical protein